MFASNEREFFSRCKLAKVRKRENSSLSLSLSQLRKRSYAGEKIIIFSQNVIEVFFSLCKLAKERKLEFYSLSLSYENAILLER